MVLAGLMHFNGHIRSDPCTSRFPRFAKQRGQRVDSGMGLAAAIWGREQEKRQRRAALPLIITQFYLHSCTRPPASM
jgi:hypothetical protein